jgi:hypothetical protein
MWCWSLSQGVLRNWNAGHKSTNQNWEPINMRTKKAVTSFDFLYKETFAQQIS